MAHRVHSQAADTYYYSLADRYESLFKGTSRKAQKVHTTQLHRLIGRRAELNAAFEVAKRSLHTTSALQHLEMRHAEIQALFAVGHQPAGHGAANGTAAAPARQEDPRRTESKQQQQHPRSAPAHRVPHVVSHEPRPVQQRPRPHTPPPTPNTSPATTHSTVQLSYQAVNGGLPLSAAPVRILAQNGMSRVPTNVVAPRAQNGSPQLATVTLRTSGSPASPAANGVLNLSAISVHTPHLNGTAHSVASSQTSVSDRTAEQAQQRQHLHSLETALRRGAQLNDCFTLFQALSADKQKRIYELLTAYFGKQDSGDATQEGINLFLENPALLVTAPGSGGRTSILDMVKEELGALPAQRTSPGTPDSIASSLPLGNPDEMNPDMTRKVQAVIERKKKAPIVHVKYDRLLEFLTRPDDNRYHSRVHGDFGVSRAFGKLCFMPNSPADRRFLRWIQDGNYYQPAMTALGSSPFANFLKDKTDLTQDTITGILSHKWGGVNKPHVYRLLKEVLKYCIIRDNTPPQGWDDYHSYQDALANSSSPSPSKRRQLNGLGSPGMTPLTLSRKPSQASFMSQRGAVNTQLLRMPGGPGPAAGTNGVAVQPQPQPRPAAPQNGVAAAVAAPARAATQST